MHIFTDQMGNRLSLPAIPQRIISLVPSQTEFLVDIGLDKEIVGITKFCVHPKEKFENTPKIGGTKNFNFSVIDQLKPDLIIGNKEENYKEGIEQLQQKYPVWMSDIVTLSDAFEMMQALGSLTGKTEVAQQLVTEIEQSFQQLIPLSTPKKVLYFIWKEPYMCAGTGTFIHEILTKVGFVNCITTPRYISLTLEEVAQYQPEVILLSSEPYPFKEKHIAVFKNICPYTTVKVIDGEVFSWYGSRLKHTVRYLAALTIT